MYHRQNAAIFLGYCLRLILKPFLHLKLTPRTYFLHIENLTWVQNQIGINGFFYRPHHIQFVLVGKLFHKFAPLIANAVLA
jgi:hypothetical protein